MPEDKKDDMTKWLLPLAGLAAAGVGVYMFTSRREPGEKKGGDKVRAKLGFKHSGAGRHVWIGFGLAEPLPLWPPDVGYPDPVNIPAENWIGGWFDVPNESEEIAHFVEVKGKFPAEFVGITVHAIKVIHTQAPPYTGDQWDQQLSSDWDARVYNY